jgi:ectoine hydroxylase-related dioxygenase (phytanoyl-CoA dioxygenase family)
MRQIFSSEADEQRFRRDGFVVLDLLTAEQLADLWTFYEASFPARRSVVPFAQALPYYISVFDRDVAHRKEVDARVAAVVAPAVDVHMIDYEVFTSNFMIKFPGDGQIEAHQDFNFVDESRHTAFNLWCPLVDTDLRNGSLYVIPGSHQVFLTQRGPNLPRALTEHNDVFKRYARRLPLAKGQAVIFDHRLIHYSPPNRSSAPRVAIQSVLTPRDASTVHYVYDAGTDRVRAHRIDRTFVQERDLWEAGIETQPVDHEQALIPVPSAREVVERLVDLTVARRPAGMRRVLADEGRQAALDRDGFVTLPVLDRADIDRLLELFRRTTGGSVQNSAYGMYIGLEETDVSRKRRTIAEISAIVLPRLRDHFVDCKPHLGSFLVKAPGPASVTHPHQDWTFVDGPEYRSMTTWIALVDATEANGTLGFIPGSHAFFDKPVGSPSPEFETCTQGHEATLLEYLRLVPLRAGEGVVFDNRTIHGAPPNLSGADRVAVAIGMTPAPAPLRHYFLVPGPSTPGRRTIARLTVDPTFFERHTIASLKAQYAAGAIPDGGATDAVFDDELVRFTADEIRLLCERAGCVRTARMPRETPPPAAEGRSTARRWLAALVGR